MGYFACLNSHNNPVDVYCLNVSRSRHRKLENLYLNLFSIPGSVLLIILIDYGIVSEKCGVLQ